MQIMPIDHVRPRQHRKFAQTEPSEPDPGAPPPAPQPSIAGTEEMGAADVVRMEQLLLAPSEEIKKDVTRVLLALQRAYSNRHHSELEFNANKFIGDWARQYGPGTRSSIPSGELQIVKDLAILRDAPANDPAVRALLFPVRRVLDVYAAVVGQMYAGEPPPPPEQISQLQAQLQTLAGRIMAEIRPPAHVEPAEAEGEKAASELEAVSLPLELAQWWQAGVKQLDPHLDSYLGGLGVEAHTISTSRELAPKDAAGKTLVEYTRFAGREELDDYRSDLETNTVSFAKQAAEILMLQRVYWQLLKDMAHMAVRTTLEQELQQRRSRLSALCPPHLLPNFPKIFRSLYPAKQGDTDLDPKQAEAIKNILLPKIVEAIRSAANSRQVNPAWLEQLLAHIELPASVNQLFGPGRSSASLDRYPPAVTLGTAAMALHLMQDVQELHGQPQAAAQFLFDQIRSWSQKQPGVSPYPSAYGRPRQKNPSQFAIAQSWFQQFRKQAVEEPVPPDAEPTGEAAATETPPPAGPAAPDVAPSDATPQAAEDAEQSAPAQAGGLEWINASTIGLASAVLWRLNYNIYARRGGWGYGGW